MSYKPRNTNLSKSSLIKGIQCSKALYLYKYHYDLKDPVSRVQQEKFNRGHKVGKLAQSLFPGGKDCTPPNIMSYDQSIKATEALVRSKYPVIYEAAFKFRGILVALDILVQKEGKWYAYEVKSSLKISKTYLQDIAIQYHVIENSGLKLEDVFIIHVNGDYTLKNNQLDINELFRIISVKDQVIELQPDIEASISRARSVLSLEDIPEIETGVQCFKPYPCDYLGFCWKGEEKNPILSIAGANISDKIEWIKSGIKEIKDIPVESLTSSRMLAQRESNATKKASINQEMLGDFMQKIQYPLYFFDIEAFQPAIPLFNETSPFQAIPFQFSIHFAASEDAPLEAKEYITNPGEDGREEFLKAFIEATEAPGQILVFNTILEKGILFKLGKLYPKYAKFIKDRMQRMVDLETPFKKDWYYHPKMNGSYSMKSILPALIDNMSYSNMNVKDGVDAMILYQQLIEEMDETIKSKTIQDLLSYCRMDTLALYHVFKSLKKITRQQTS